MPDLVTPDAGAVGGANPLVPVRLVDAAGALGRWAGALAARPPRLAGQGARLGAELARVVAGRSGLAPEPGDRRFADPTWADNPLYRRILQGYLACREAVHGSVAAAGLDGRASDQARFVLALLTEAAAPTNTLAGNPAALKRALETGGGSLVRGARHAWRDVVSNGAMPRMVDDDAFTVGQTVAATPGAVVLRRELCELIQYAPTTDTVHQRPLVIVPPQINKYYAIDLSPGRSFVEYAVSRGLQVFVISWRNPTPAQREWNLDAYLGATLEALEAAAEITGSGDCNALGLCSGGITLAAVLGHLAGAGRPLVRSATLGVTGLDTQADSPLQMFASEAAVRAAVARSRRRGVLDGRSMARMFAWLRPNDLVWNYWVNNYLMGAEPPPFDVLYWNADTTNLPAGLHADYLRMFLDNSLVHPGGLTALGVPVDLGTVDVDVYAMAGRTDHIVPWDAAYRSARLFGGDVEFVLSSSGHIQSIVNPPGNPKASYFAGGKPVDEPGDWLQSAERLPGSWWEHWASWATERSGPSEPAPAALGSARYPATDPAPGRYVLG
jgi:polyhydroxyalkanoate synthase